MTIRFILALAGRTAQDEGVLQIATKLGQAFQSHVTFLHVLNDPAVLSSSANAALTTRSALLEVDEFRATTLAQSRQMRALAEAACRSSGTTLLAADAEVPAGCYCAVWSEVSGSTPRELALRGRLVDLVVVPRPDRAAGTDGIAVVEAALFETGRTAVIVPPKVPETIGQSVLITWNGSPQAARAVQSALPFLARAQRVLVLTLAENGTPAESNGIIYYLAGHGIAAESHLGKSDKGAVGERIVDGVRTSSSDLLVMGAYGYGRLNEIMLGGATESVLKYAQVPVVMAH